MAAWIRRQMGFWLLASCIACAAACSAGSGGTGTTSVTISPDVATSVPEAPVVVDPNDVADLPADSDLPIVSTPTLPGNVPVGSVWINPAPEEPYDVTGPVSTDVFYNQLGSVTFANDLAAIVQTDPNFILRHITLIGRSLSNRKVYNITLYDPGTGDPIEVPVDDLLLASKQRVLRDGVPISRDKLSKIIWPALYVKAVASYLGGYDANYSNTMKLLTGSAYGPTQSVFKVQPGTVDPILSQINTNTPVVGSSIAVSTGDAVTSVSPDDPNVTVVTQGYTFGCTTTQGVKGAVNICLQVNTAHYIISYTNGDVRLRATTPHTGGDPYDGKYGFLVDGSTVMPLETFIRLMDQIKPLSTPLP